MKNFGSNHGEEVSDHGEPGPSDASETKEGQFGSDPALWNSIDESFRSFGIVKGSGTCKNKYLKKKNLLFCSGDWRKESYAVRRSVFFSAAQR